METCSFCAFMFHKSTKIYVKGIVRNFLLHVHTALATNAIDPLPL